LENITFENYSEIKSCAFYASSLKSCDFNSTGFERNSFYGCVCQNLKFNISNDDIPVFQVIEFYACDFLNIDISNKIELKNITFLSCLSEIMYSPEEFEFQIEVHTDKVNDIREFNSNNPEANDGFHFQIINSSLSQTLNNKYSIELQNCIK
jgi:hypothetical protein